MKNREIAELFGIIADVLELKKDNPFKIRAYRRASQIIGDMSQDIEKISHEGKLKEIPGIGEGIAKKIEEYLQTGRMKILKEAKRGIPEELISMMGIPSLGPKSLAQIYKELKVKNLKDLERALKSGKIAELKGFGEKKAENITRGISLFKGGMERMPLGVALPIAQSIVERLKKDKNVKSIEPAGSLRRLNETIGDIDILATGKNGKKIVDAFVRLPQVTEILAAGKTKGSIRVEDGKQVDLRVVDESSFGSALQYFTGSKNHNIRIREIAKDKRLKLSEYGLFKEKRKVAGKTEKEIYQKLGLPWIPPEIREDTGEVELALKGKIPNLVEGKDIKGDFHVHTERSDGFLSVKEVAQYAKKLGYSYVVIADHSRSLRVGGGLSIDGLKKQMEEIDKINKKLKGIKVLRGSEVDILSNGKLDFPDRLLTQLDVVIAAIHSGFAQLEEQITKRILAAIENPNVHIIAHPTGRLIGEREPYKVNMEKVMEAAKENAKALEINAYYLRLDLNHIHCRMAREMGVKVAIGTDAHQADQFQMIKYGVAMARKGWLGSSDVINTLSLAQLRKWLGETL
jgi:DNA polymerase (family 10)